MEQQPSSNKKIMAIIGLAVIVAVVGVGVAATSGKPGSTGTSPMSAGGSNMPAMGSGPMTQSTSNYKDGTYTATGTYDSPGSTEHIGITLSLKNGNITDTRAVEEANEDEGRDYQRRFISGYKSMVVGKNIDEIQLTRVSGSSLTSQGFNDALEKIKSQAKAS